MSEGSKETAQLAARLAQLEAEAAQLETAWARSKSVNRTILLVLVLVVGGVLYTSYDMITQIENPQWQTDMVEELKKSFELNQQEYEAEFKRIWGTVQPRLIKAFREQIQEDSPRFKTAFIAERDQFERNIKIKFKEALREHYKKALDRHEAILRTEFPELQDKQRSARVIAKTQLAIDELIDKYYIGPLEKEFQTLYASYEEFPIADPPDLKTGEKPLPSQFVGQALELLKLKLISAPDPVALP
tara:strand:+ start:1432 stop:2166 length:735 start_codon:yes stop_codon:yes gene_type:complete